MTPMIDVVFQLLIYFLCTASFAASEQFLPTILPPTGAAANEPPREIQELELVEISLSQAADTLRIELNGNAVSSIAELRDRLLQLVALAKLPVVLDIGPEVHLSNVVAVYDLCVVIGLNGIHFAAPNTN
jgi:biopolymer transport protein ExbD